MKYLVRFAFIFISLLVINGCSLQKIWKDNTIQKTLTKETLREYKPEGAFIFGTFGKGNNSLVSGAMLMMTGAADLYLSLKDNEINPFLIDVPFDCEGISKIGIRYNYQGSVLDQWILDNYKFKLLSNAVKAYTNEQNTVMNRIENNAIVSITNRKFVVEYMPQVYYLGRINIKVKKSKDLVVRDAYEIEITNMIDYDQEKFVENYPRLTNADFIYLDMKKVQY